MNATSVAHAFADKLSRAGLMTDQDTEMLCAISVRTGKRGPLWTAKEDRELRRLARLHQATVIAEKLGRTAWAVRSRIRTLKRKERDHG